MKIKYTTKVFIAVNAIAVLFRTLQIILLTEKDTGFLKEGFTAVNIIGTVVTVFAFLLLFTNAAQAVRQPEKVNCSGTASAAVAMASGVLCFLGGMMSLGDGHAFGTPIFFLSLVFLAVCTVIALSAFGKCAFPKAALLIFTAYWVLEFVSAYLFYTERPLRVRTVHETFALCFVILFFVTLGKAVCGVKSELNFRRIYPLGLTASGLCILSLLPELIATLCGFKANVTESAVMPLTLASAALFIGFFTINTFKKSNTVHPKRKKMLAEEKLRATERERIGNDSGAEL